MNTCTRCGVPGLDPGVPLCDPCVRLFGTIVQELEDQGIDAMDPDDPLNPFAPPR